MPARRFAFVGLFLSSGMLILGCDDGAGSGAAGGGTGVTGPGGTGATAPSTSTGEGGAPPAPVPGLYAEYFTGYLDLAKGGVEPGVDVDWLDAGPEGVGADRFSARWTGALTPPAAGTYTFATETDDGVRVWIDDVLVIDDWRGHFVTRNE